MKKILVILLFVLPFGLFARENKIIKIGYINVQNVLKSYFECKKFVDYLKNLKDSYEKKKVELENDIKRLEKELETRAKDLNENQVRDYLTQIESKRRELEAYVKNANQDIDKKEKEMLTPVYQKILQTIKEEAPKMRFNFIIDSKYVLVADPDLDITDAIIRILEKK